MAIGDPTARPVVYLRPLGSETTEYSDVLVENSSEADRWVTLAWQKLRTTRSGDIVSLPFVRANSRLHRIISQERPMSAWVNSISSVSWDGYEDWESYYPISERRFSKFAQTHTPSISTAWQFIIRGGNEA